MLSTTTDVFQVRTELLNEKALNAVAIRNTRSYSKVVFMVNDQAKAREEAWKALYDLIDLTKKQGGIDSFSKKNLTEDYKDGDYRIDAQNDRETYAETSFERVFIDTATRTEKHVAIRDEEFDRQHDAMSASKIITRAREERRTKPQICD